MEAHLTASRTVDLSGCTRTGATVSWTGELSLSEAPRGGGGGGGAAVSAFASAQWAVAAAPPRQQNLWRASSAGFQKRRRHRRHWNAACLRWRPRCRRALSSEPERRPHAWQRRRARRPALLAGWRVARCTSRAPGSAKVALGQMGHGKRLMGTSMEVRPATRTAPPLHDVTRVRPPFTRSWARIFFFLICACSRPLLFLSTSSFLRVSLLSGTPTSFPSRMMLWIRTRRFFFRGVRLGPGRFCWLFER
ncbi:hypothetical protein EYF80_048083 [Liparis tanakae]|uniref:Uncharacterized protein n=1 Tax=Liparis tanakae TaxID=230148 RepID=A0A4Z2FKS3_9TELE|nr:hypothetical protein EYF80_048083 [Liparis tanakae]